MLKESSEPGPDRQSPDKMAGADEAVDIAENGRRAEVLQHEREGGLNESVVVVERTEKRKMPKINLNFPSDAATLNHRFLLTISGLIKVVKIILALSAFVCVLSSFAFAGPEVTWTLYVVWTTILLNILTISIYVALPHLLEDVRNLKGLLFIEMVLCVLGALLYLIAVCVMANWAALGSRVYPRKMVAGASVACILTFVLMLVDIFAAFHYYTQWSGANPFKRTPVQKA